ncbi:MAG: hypothetical protein JSS66_13905 [Armatimonadetes bacterium]|nr:hypothetical protein [Armatimonadota bacterium]
MLQSLMEQSAASSRPRLSDAVVGRSSAGFQNLTALPSNISAIEAAMRFVDGTCVFLALSGPSGWGKSHLLVAVTEQLNRAHPGSATVVSALQWLKQSGRDTVPVLLIDDIQDVMSHPRTKYQFRRKLDLRVRTGRPTLVAWNQAHACKYCRSLLPSSRQWVFANIAEPRSGERELVVLQIASRMGLQLSKPIARLVAKHLHGNGRSISGALQRLRMAKSDWTLDNDVLEACGLLSPYLLGSEGWDPRDQVQEAVSGTLGGSEGGVRPSDVSCYLLLGEMGISESEVADFMRVSPSAVYTRAKNVRTSLSDPQVKTLVDACRNAVLRGFREE